MTTELRIPPCWMAEAKEAYAQYRSEFEVEEAEAAILTGRDPEIPEDWDSFFASYLYAELQAAAYSDFLDSLPTSED